jgi:hypothetical protein
MQRLQRLRLGGLHRHGLNPRTPRRFEQAFGVHPVRLVASHIGLHVLDRQQPDVMPLRLTAAAPVVCGSTGFHYYGDAGRQRVDKRLELPTRQALPLHDSPRTIRHRHFKDILCQVHRHRRSIHVGLLFVQLVEPKPSPRHMMPRTNGEESIPIIAAE